MRKKGRDIISKTFMGKRKDVKAEIVEGNDLVTENRKMLFWHCIYPGCIDYPSVSAEHQLCDQGIHLW